MKKGFKYVLSFQQSVHIQQKMKTTILIFLKAILFTSFLSMVATLPGENHEKNWGEEEKTSKSERKAVEEIKKKQQKVNRELETSTKMPLSHTRRPKLFTKKKESDDEEEEDKNVKAHNSNRVVGSSSKNQRGNGRH